MRPERQHAVLAQGDDSSAGRKHGVLQRPQHAAQPIALGLEGERAVDKREDGADYGQSPDGGAPAVGVANQHQVKRGDKPGLLVRGHRRAHEYGRDDRAPPGDPGRQEQEHHRPFGEAAHHVIPEGDVAQRQRHEPGAQARGRPPRQQQIGRDDPDHVGGAELGPAQSHDGRSQEKGAGRVAKVALELGGVAHVVPPRRLEGPQLVPEREMGPHVGKGPRL